MQKVTFLWTQVLWGMSAMDVRVKQQAMLRQSINTAAGLQVMRWIVNANGSSTASLSFCVARPSSHCLPASSAFDVL